MAIRVLHIVTYMDRGGLETMLMNYYRHIDRDKVQFDFLVHRDFEADYDKEILSLGGRIYRTSRLIPWSSKYKNNLRSFFKNHPEYKIVHVHQNCLSSVALQCTKECGVPVRIAHSHISYEKDIKYPIKLYYKAKIPKFATDMFACSELAGRWMFGNNKFTVLPNAIDINEYVYLKDVSDKVRRDLNINDEIVIGHVGRFHPQKNHSFLIDIFSEIVKQNSNVKLLLVGDGDGKKEIEAKVKRLGIQDKVIFTGVRDDVNRLLQAMDVFLFPSLYEGLGIVAIEAQASGLPCVISNSVPKDCDITSGLVKFISLSDLPADWASVVLKQSKIIRTNRSDEIISAGYDIFSTAKNLENFYLECYIK